MTVGLLGKKIGMTQVFDDQGLAIPVTVVKLGENIVTATRTKEKHGYTAVQVGGFTVKDARLNKPEAGHLKKQELPSLKPLKEFRVKDTASYKVGEPVPVESIVKDGMLVDVRGSSIGKGFQGTVKRYGAGTTPGRVFRGVMMPGQMGNENVCNRKLTVVRVDTEKGLLLVKGAVPGVEGGLLVITPSKTKWN